MTALAFLAAVFLTQCLITQSCDKTIIKTIQHHLVKEDIMEFMKDKTFLDVWIARTICFGCITGSVRCSWIKVEEEKKKLKIRHFFKTRVFTFHGTVKAEHWKWLSRLDTGVYVEKNINTDEPEYFFYPLYMNKDAGVIAFHRCVMNGKYPWYTTISVLNEKYTDPPLGMTAGVWKAIREAREMIESWKLNHHKRIAKVIQDPYGCKNRLYSPGL